MKAERDGISLTLSGQLDRDSAIDSANYTVRAWSLRRTKNYGSKHIDERTLKVTKAELADDGKSVRLTIPEMAPTWCMEIRYRLKSAEGLPVNGRIHNSVHELPE